eukprot:728274-Rhodomonas_salina.2
MCGSNVAYGRLSTCTQASLPLSEPRFWKSSRYRLYRLLSTLWYNDPMIPCAVRDSPMRRPVPAQSLPRFLDRPMRCLVPRVDVLLPEGRARGTGGR